MESPTDWTASALFSPSKARAQQAQARDWAFVDSWLAKKYGKKVPVFERNGETLEALLKLATINEGADEQATLIDRVEKLVLSRHDQHDLSAYRDVLSQLTPDGQDALTALAQSAVLLNSSDVLKMTAASCMLINDQFELSAQLMRAEAQQQMLGREKSRLLDLLGYLNQDAFACPPDLAEQIPDWTRDTKQLRAKVTEYEERLGVLRSSAAVSPSIEEVMLQSQNLAEQQRRLKNLNKELAAFESLPTDPTAARKRVETARGELQRLVNKRDRLFERLAEGG